MAAVFWWDKKGASGVDGDPLKVVAAVTGDLPAQMKPGSQIRDGYLPEYDSSNQRMNYKPRELPISAKDERREQLLRINRAELRLAPGDPGYIPRIRKDILIPREYCLFVSGSNHEIAAATKVDHDHGLRSLVAFDEALHVRRLTSKGFGYADWHILGIGPMSYWTKPLRPAARTHTPQPMRNEPDWGTDYDERGWINKGIFEAEGFDRKKGKAFSAVEIERLSDFA
jgi:hypothetical protein